MDRDWDRKMGPPMQGRGSGNQSHQQQQQQPPRMARMGQSTSTSGQFYQQLQIPGAPSSASSSTGPRVSSGGSSSSALTTPTGSDGAELLNASSSIQFDERSEALIRELAADLDRSHPEYCRTLAKRLFERSLDQKTMTRKEVSGIVHGMFRRKQINRKDFQYSVEDVLLEAGSMVIDVPMLWDYSAEYFVPPLHERLITLQDAQQIATSTIADTEQKPYECWLLCRKVLQIYEAAHGKDATVKLWYESPLDLKVFGKPGEDEAAVRQRMVDAKLGYLLECKVASSIREFLRNDAPNETIFQWISSHVSEQQENSSEFIRTLTTVVLEHCINKTKLDTAKIEKWHMLLQRYIQGKAERELQALYAVQLLVERMQHPQHLLQTIFQQLHEFEVVMEGFHLWKEERSDHEIEGRGVCIKSTRQFFVQLMEPDSESEDGGKDSDSDDGRGRRGISRKGSH